MEMDECCFCGGECNQMSQLCGSCSRGIVGGCIPIRPPVHLKKYLNNYCCQSCGTKENNIQLSEIKDYEESTFIYCLDCLGKNDNDLIYDCKCNGEKCEYC